MNDLREKLADLCHRQWSGWMEYLFSKCDLVSGKAVIPEWAVQRWQMQIDTPYKDLSLDEQESDRKEADKFLEIFNKEIKALKAENERLRNIILEHEQWAKLSYKQTTKIFDFVKSKPAGKPLPDPPRGE